MLWRKRCSVERLDVAILRRRNVGGAGLTLRVLWRSRGASFLPGSESRGPPASDGKAWLRLDVTAAWTRRTAFQSYFFYSVFLKPIFHYCSECGALLATYTSNCIQNLNWMKVNDFHLVFVCLSVDSASTELGLSKMFMWHQYSWWNKDDLTVGKILIFKLKLPC